MGQFSGKSIDKRMERTGRAYEKSVCARSQSVGIELRFSGGGLGEFVRGSDWDGDGWLDRLAGDPVWHRRFEADGGLVEPKRDHSDFQHAGYGRAAGADGA